MSKKKFTEAIVTRYISTVAQEKKTRSNESNKRKAQNDTTTFL
jgi:hypothetical protein